MELVLLKRLLSYLPHISWPGPIFNDDGDDSNEDAHAADKDDDDVEATSISYPMYPSELAG